MKTLLHAASWSVKWYSHRGKEFSIFLKFKCTPMK